MSVVLSKRGESKLAVITKASELSEYTIRICTNEKSFPKRYRWCITNKIVESAVEINININRANAIYVGDKSDFELRKHYQNKALAEISAMIANMDIAYRVFSVEDKRIVHWTGLIIELQRLVRGWKKADANKFEN